MAPSTAPFPHNLQFHPVDPSTIGVWLDFTNSVFGTPYPDGSAPFLSVFFPSGITPEITAWALQAHNAALPKPTEHYALVRDPAQPDNPVVATARWTEVPTSTAAEREEAEAEALRERQESATKPVPGVSYETFGAWRPAQSGGWIRVLGDRAHVYLKILAVRQDWQGKGVGKALLRHICGFAQEKGLPVYLESSAAGVPVYKKVGFTDRGYIDWDAKKLGHEKSFKHLAMLWEPEETTTKA